MPKEPAPQPLPLSRSHRGSLPLYHPYAQQYHAPRPPGFQYYPNPAVFGSNPNELPVPVCSSLPQSSLRDMPSTAYDHNVKLTNKYDRNNAMVHAPYPSVPVKMPTYDRRPMQGGPTPMVPLSQPHKVSYERPSHTSVAPSFERIGPNTIITPVETKSVPPVPSRSFDRFSKKKLAAYSFEKMVAESPFKGRNEKKAPCPTSYERPHIPSTSYERIVTKPVSPPVAYSEHDKVVQNLSHEWHKVYEQVTQLYGVGQGVQRAQRRPDPPERPVIDIQPQTQPTQFEHRNFDPPPVPVSRSYERINTSQETIPPTTSAYERPPVNLPQTTSYERMPMSSAAYERRAVFDRAYEQAAYERRHHSFANINPYYNTQFPRTGQPDRLSHAEEYEAKELPAYPAKPRMSLLTSSEYLSSMSRRTQMEDNSRCGQPSVIVPPSRSPAETSTTRKSILSGGKPPEPLPPLTIDTSMSSPKADSAEKPSIYMPTVEPISPTFPADPPAEAHSPRRSLLSDIGRVHKEIDEVEHLIFNLKRKKTELERKAKIIETNTGDEVKEAPPLPKHFSLSHKIYSENRRRAKEAHDVLNHLGPPVDLPLYNQPSDTTVYQENKRKHAVFKNRLIEYLKRKRCSRSMKEKRMTDEYAGKTEIWHRLVEKMESSPERKRRDAENRELFEKVFPKIRKEREDKERFLRVGSRVKSDADFEEIMDNLHEQEMEVKKMRAYAAVPPMLLDSESRRCVFVNNNGLVDDFPAAYKERRLVNVWTDTEKYIFREKYILYPKNFGVIASYLERKSVSDCVQYYYLTKKTENYKRLLKKSGLKSRTARNRNKAAPAPSADSICAPMISSIAPRFQRDYKPDVNQTSSPIEHTSPTAHPPPTPLEAPSISLTPSNQDPPPLNSPIVVASPPTDCGTVAVSDPTPPPTSVPVPTVSPPPFTLESLPALKPLLAPLREIPIVVIDDSDDSNSSSQFTNAKK